MKWLKNKLLGSTALTALVIILAAIAITGTILSIATFYLTGTQEALFSRGFCLKNDCIEFFNKEFSATLAILGATGTLLGGVATLGGIIVALLSYISTVKSTAVSNHISHINIFITYVQTEIDKRDRLSRQSFDILKWYNLMYSNSAKGILNISPDYADFLRKLNMEIQYSNDLYTKKKHGGYRYKHHQETIKERLETLGITLRSMPRLDFNEVEEQVVSIITTVNYSFCKDGSAEAISQRLYT